MALVYERLRCGTAQAVRATRDKDASHQRDIRTNACGMTAIIRALKDDDAAAAQAAGLHGAVGIGRTLWRVLAGDPPRDGTARRQVAQLVQPIGTRQCFRHHDRPNADIPLP